MKSNSRNLAYVFSLVTISILGMAAGYFNVYSDVSVTVSAIVGSGNNPPAVLSLNPESSPVVVSKGTLQAFSLRIQDIDSPNVSYTITASTGATSPINGNLTNATLLTSGDASVNFTYFAPSTKAGSSSITITLNDGTNVVVRNIALYVY